MIPNEALNSEVQEIYGDSIKSPAVAEEDLRLADFVPSRRSILVEPLAPDKQTKGGLVIPEAAQVDKSLGIVVALNPGDIESEYQIGDMVYFRYGAGQQIRIEGRDVVILQYFGDLFGDILGRWPKDTIPMAMKEKA